MEFQELSTIRAGYNDPYRAGSLRGFIQPRVIFDPTNRKHLEEYAAFLKHNRWVNNCPFLCEDPWTDIPAMINYKIAVHHLRKRINDR